MAPHYVWIKGHLLLIAEALESMLQDEIDSVRLRGARCLDVVVHSINTHLLSQSNNKSGDFESDMEVALQFWTKMSSILTEQLQDVTQSSAIKSIFCDGYSDIGVHVYERLPVNSINRIDYGLQSNKYFISSPHFLLQRAKQIHTISMLSGISLGDDEAIVRASAVRALAIFVMFPSLKEGKQYEQRNIDLRPTQIAYHSLLSFQTFAILKTLLKLLLN